MLFVSLLQIYFYADYVFRQAGISEDKIPYTVVGTGACECITALTCVSIPFVFLHISRHWNIADMHSLGCFIFFFQQILSSQSQNDDELSWFDNTVFIDLLPFCAVLCF